MKKCENCSIDHDGSIGSGRFCSLKCSRSFSTKSKRKEINEKVSLTLKGRESPKKGNYIIERIIEKCSRDNCNVMLEKYFDVGMKFCSKACASSYSSKKRCNSLEERNRMREIGRKGGFGKKGITKNGTRYESGLEKICFEYLEDLAIKFQPHKQITGSSKVCDVYINDFDLWIEIDGINREKRKKWLGKQYEYWKNKLEIYEEKKLDYSIVYSLLELQDLMTSKLKK